jgi:hypothetical protein
MIGPGGTQTVAVPVPGVHVQISQRPVETHVFAARIIVSTDDAQKDKHLDRSSPGRRVYTEHDPGPQVNLPIIRFQSSPADNGGRSRRDLFRLAGAITAGATLGPNRSGAAEPDGPQIGILLATTFTTGTLEERLDAARACGLACVQMCRP